jgi:hypothetical protein
MQLSETAIDKIKELNIYYSSVDTEAERQEYLNLVMQVLYFLLLILNRERS